MTQTKRRLREQEAESRLIIDKGHDLEDLTSQEESKTPKEKTTRTKTSKHSVKRNNLMNLS